MSLGDHRRNLLGHPHPLFGQHDERQLCGGKLLVVQPYLVHGIVA
jgi:hypothetical protein